MTADKRDYLTSPKRRLFAVTYEFPRTTMPVEIVRPKRKWPELLGMLIAAWLGVFITSAVVMLLVGACHHEIDARIPAFGYLQTVLGVYTLRTLVSAVMPWDTYKLWSREAKSR